MGLKKLVDMHNAIRDRVWAFATKENPSVEKMFAYLPKTEKTKVIHWIDDKFTNFKNHMQKIERKFLALLFLLFVVCAALCVVQLLFSFIFRNF